LDVDTMAIRDEAWFRHTRPGADFWIAPDPPPDGRWQRGDVVRAIYLADSEATAWAEWYRALAEREVPPEHGFPRLLWRVEVTLERVADLSTAERLARLALPVPRPSLADWSPFQAAGERLFAAGFQAIIAPSAARPEVGRSLVVFRTGERVAGLRPVGRPRRISRPPALPRGLRT
jgi:RES domain-containing protein